MSKVSLVIVSHSPKIAAGTVDMIRQVVGTDVLVAWTGGNADGGLGTDVQAIKKAIEEVWSEAGVAVFVDLGGAEMNSEMAIQMLDSSQRNRVVICNAPIVEGAVLAATDASGGMPLQTIVAAAETLMES